MTERRGGGKCPCHDLRERGDGGPGFEAVVGDFLLT
jgi:hypothetical protein